MRRAACCSLLLLALLLVLSGAATRAYGAPQPAVPTFRVTACSTDPAEVSKLDRFQQSFLKFDADLGKLHLAADDVQTLLVEALAQSKSNTYRMIEAANDALISLNDYRAKLDALGLDFDAMQRSADFTNDRGVASLIKAGLGVIDGGISKLFVAADNWQEAAKAFIAYNYDAAESNMESGATGYGDGVAHGIQNGAAMISAAILALHERSSCRDASQVTRPLSAAGIERAARANGTQRAGGGDLSVVAPKRLKSKTRGPTQLPITVKVSKPGQIEIWLQRGPRLVINVHGTAFKKGEFGLLLTVPRTAAKGGLKLRLTFIPPAAVTPSKTVSLAIRSA